MNKIKIIKVEVADIFLWEEIRKYLYDYGNIDKKVKKKLEDIFNYLDTKIFNEFYKEHKDFEDIQLLIKTTYKN